MKKFINPIRRLDWNLIAATVILQSLVLTIILIVFPVFERKGWRAVLWTQEGAGWAAAVTTFAAVVVALYTSFRSESLIQKLRKKDKKHAERVRIRKQRALCAAIADEMADLLYDLKFCIGKIDGEEKVSVGLLKSISLQIANTDAPILASATGHLEVFDDKFAQLAARAAAQLRTLRRSMKDLHDVAKEEDLNDETVSRFRETLQMQFNKYQPLHKEARQLAGISSPLPFEQINQEGLKG